MIFFSELKNKKVYTEDRVLVGWLDDLVFDIRDIPTITKLIVRSKKLHHTRLFIPGLYLLSLSQSFTLAKNYQTDYLSENEMYVAKNLIDKQIIDIEGKKVVRVNDVVLKKTGQSTLTILGVDTGLLGILRWLGAEDITKKIASIFRKKIQSSTLPWSHIQPLELTEGKVRLNINQDKLKDIHPEDLADYLEATSMDNIMQTINLLDPEFAAEVIAELNLNYQVLFFKNIAIKKAISILQRMDPDEAVDVLAQFTPKKRTDILNRLDSNKRKELEELLSYSSTEVGEFLTTEYLSVDADATSIQTIEKIRQQTEELSYLDHIYVTNKSEQLIGVFNLHELLMQPSQVPVRKYMIENPVTVHLHTPLKSVQRKLIKYKLSAIPVVNEYKKMIGIITFDDVGEFFLKKM